MEVVIFKMERVLIIVVFIVLLSGCLQTKKLKMGSLEKVEKTEISQNIFSLEEVFFDRKQSLWLLSIDSSLVSGYVKKRFLDGSLELSFSVFEGKKEGSQITYFPDGQVKFEESYEGNRLDGDVKRWSKMDGYQLVAHLKYEEGKLHGEQKKWYSTGEIHKVLNMNMGKEEGIQQAYRKNGVLYANYEALNGRTFGMKRSNLCVELNDEKIISKN